MKCGYCGYKIKEGEITKYGCHYNISECDKAGWRRLIYLEREVKRLRRKSIE